MAVGRGFTGWGLDVTRHTHSHTTTLDTTPHSDSYILYEVFFQLRLGEKPGCHTGVPQLLDIFNLKKKKPTMLQQYTSGLFLHVK